MDSDELYSLYKEQYERELTRRVELNNAVALPLGVITLIGGALVAAVREFQRPFDVFEAGILVCFAVTIIFLALAAYNLWRSYYNNEYHYLPTAKQIMDWRNSLQKHHDSFSPQAEVSNVDAEVKKLLKNMYAEFSHLNTLNNDDRSAFIHTANTYLMYSIAWSAVIGCMFFTKILFAS